MQIKIVNSNDYNQLKLKAESLLQEVDLASKIIADISNNDLELQYTDLAKENHLAKSILNMRDTLAEVRKKEKQHIWITEGISEFSEILRGHNSGVKAICLSIISYLVKYVNANQGFIFIYNKSIEALELNATYAYHRNKLLERTILPGEGIVGQCFLEKEPIYLTDIPEGYCNITSGLGYATPNCLSVIPLKNEDEVLGVIEIASFNVFSNAELDFLNKISKELSISLKSIMIAEHTKQMLEQSNSLTLAMQEQEESLRQNFEELQATQEELVRKEKDNIKTIEELNAKHQQALQEAIEREEHLKEIKKELILKLTSNNILIDVAGRQRMLSQKIGFYAEMVVRGNISALMGLEAAMNMHEKTLEAIRNGGVPPGFQLGESLAAAPPELIPIINQVNKQWQDYKKAANTILEHGKKTKLCSSLELEQSIAYIENHGEEMLAVNNKLLLECSKYNKNRILEMYQ